MTERSDRQDENELMDIEDQLVKEMQEEFRFRLQNRLQERARARERELGKVQPLKKKTRLDVPDKRLRKDQHPRIEGILPTK